MKRRMTAAGILLTATAVVAACGGGTSTTTPRSGPTSIGAGEGALNLIVWAGYAENGSSSPSVNWVTPFQQQTGCITNAKIANTSDEMVSLMQTHQYDGVSASGNASLRLMVDGSVAPVNVNLLTNYADVNPALKDQPYNTYKGPHHRAPHG